MSQPQRRSSRHVVGSKAKIQPAILKARKRKVSENELEPEFVKQKSSKGSMEDPKPLEDVTSTSLNVERERAITPDASEEYANCRVLTCYPTPQSTRKAPLPQLDWADKEQVWDFMRRKDSVYTNKKDSNLISKHEALQPRMRSILLDWLTEVCEVYKLHRETYYLAADYIDRYLSSTKNVPKAQLQLIGITCLFIAAKIEEIYPPKLSEFSYVTDGACTDKEILDKELVILKTLNWDLTPITVNSWLNTYLQILCSIYNKQETNRESEEFVFPQYSGFSFVQLSRLIDLCVLDTDCLRFSSSLLAATALCYSTNFSLAFHVSGFDLNDVQKCYQWMAPFAAVVENIGVAAPLKTFNQIATDDSHNIQTHAIDLEILDKVYSQQLPSVLRSSPPTMQIPPEVLTPPKTNEKRGTAIYT